MVKRSHGKAAAALIAIAAAGAAGFRYYRKGKAPTGGQNAVLVEKGDLETHFLDSGELTPKVYGDVTSKVSGRVTEVDVEEGQRVKKGEKLAVIQPGRTEAEKYVPLTVAAPLDGIVMRYQKQGGSSAEEGKILKLGDYVSGLLDTQSPTYLMTIGDLSRLIVQMKISEMDVLKLREGLPVAVSVDALPGEKLKGRVALISPQAERDKNDLKNFRVEVALERYDPRLKPGMTARVDGLLDSRKGVVKIPLSAVFEEGDREYAYLRGPDGKAKKSDLKLGLRSELDAEVLSGVKAGDSVLTENPDAKASTP